MDEDSGFRRLTGTELATRVSFFLTAMTHEQADTERPPGIATPGGSKSCALLE